MDDTLLDIAELVHNDKYVQKDLSKYSSTQSWVKDNNNEYSQFIAAYENGKLVGYSLLRRDPIKTNEYQLVHSYAVNNNARIYNSLEVKAQEHLRNRGFSYKPLFIKETSGISIPNILETIKTQQQNLIKHFPNNRHQRNLELLVA